MNPALSPVAPERGFDEAEFAARTARAQREMALAGIAGLLLMSEPEVRYFSGFQTLFWQSPTRPWFLFVPATGTLESATGGLFDATGAPLDAALHRHGDRILFGDRAWKGEPARLPAPTATIDRDVLCLGRGFHHQIAIGRVASILRVLAGSGSAAS